MTHAADLPGWAAVVTAALVLIGALLALIGSIGLLRLKTFYSRMHAPTLGSTLGIGSILIASMLFFSVLQTRFVLHEILITVFMVMTTPVTFMLLAGAALHRDRQEGNQTDAPSSSPDEGGAAP